MLLWGVKKDKGQEFVRFTQTTEVHFCQVENKEVFFFLHYFYFLKAAVSKKKKQYVP